MISTAISLFWTLIFILVVLLLATIAFILGLVSTSIVIAALCVIATLTGTAICVSACLTIAKAFRRLNHRMQIPDVMMTAHGDVPGKIQ